MQSLVYGVQARALQLRVDCVRCTTEAGSGHPTTCMSSADIVACLFFHEMRIDLSNSKNPNNDRFILSKGHGAPLLYAAYKQLGVVSDDELLGMRKIGSHLEGHPTPKFEWCEAATGSLGQGLGIGVGEALCFKRMGAAARVFVLLGDGECSEGSVWESASIAEQLQLENLIAIVDCNRLGQSGPSLHGHDVIRWGRKFEAFGWFVQYVDGHDVKQILPALEKTRANSTGKPMCIVAKTLKGYPITEVTDRIGFHGKPFESRVAPDVIAELKRRDPRASAVTLALGFHAMPPAEAHEHRPPTTPLTAQTDRPTDPHFGLGKALSTRKAFAMGLASLAIRYEGILAFDCDVKNSTYFELLEKETPSRLIQGYIAEQNMVEMAVGAAACGFTPFLGTFACFYSRAFDQLRMAGIGRAALRCAGTHAGVSIGEDGPSQMGLEDIALFRAIPNSVVLAPSDPVSAYRMAGVAAAYSEGVCYVRLCRPDSRAIYAADEEFRIGGCKVLAQGPSNAPVIIASGITVAEALAAVEALRGEGLAVTLVDLYCIKPLDTNTLFSVGKMAQSIIVVEDHYACGGVGEAVKSALAQLGICPAMKHLAVPDVPMSGTPRDLMRWAGIDSKAIASAVRAVSHLVF